jgi:hypothetical protein
LRFAWRAARQALMSSILLGLGSRYSGSWLAGGKCGIRIPCDQVFDSLQVYSYRDFPRHDGHFVVG